MCSLRASGFDSRDNQCRWRPSKLHHRLHNSLGEWSTSQRGRAEQESRQQDGWEATGNKSGQRGQWSDMGEGGAWWDGNEAWEQKTGARLKVGGSERRKRRGSTAERRAVVPSLHWIRCVAPARQTLEHTIPAWLPGGPTHRAARLYKWRLDQIVALPSGFRQKLDSTFDWLEGVHLWVCGVCTLQAWQV
jgi:hypothetical protein